IWYGRRAFCTCGFIMRRNSKRIRLFDPPLPPRGRRPPLRRMDVDGPVLSRVVVPMTRGIPEAEVKGTGAITENRGLPLTVARGVHGNVPDVAPSLPPVAAVQGDAHRALLRQQPFVL